MVAEAAADVPEAHVSFTNIAMDPEPTTANFASLEADARATEEMDILFATAATILSATESPTCTAAAVVEVLDAAVKVFVAGAEVFVAVVNIFVTDADVLSCLACKKRASIASSTGKERHLVRQKKKKVSARRRRGIKNMM